MSQLTQVRLHHPGRIAAAWRDRQPGVLPSDGRLMVIAADHPARGALGVRGDALAMASRGELLERAAAALGCPGVDGVLGTADILEDLLLMGLLEGKFVFGSMNRAGLQGAEFEFDDRWTGYDPQTIAAHGLNGGKMLTRIALEDPACAAILEATGHVITELAGRHLISLVEPFLARRLPDRRVQNLLDVDSVVRSVTIAAGLGATSAYTWLKLPVVAGMERVLDATTLPTLLLGGDPEGDPSAVYAQWRAALAHPVVVGLVVGRTMLYPLEGDPAQAARIAAAMVHGGAR